MSSTPRTCPKGIRFTVSLQGQFASGPLVSSEEFSLGGWDTVRGYYESEALGDNAVAGSIELRSPDVGSLIQKNLKDSSGHPLRVNVFDEWRFFAFGDGGLCTVQQPTIGEQASFWLASYGVGTRFKAFDYFKRATCLGDAGHQPNLHARQRSTSALPGLG